MLSVRGIVWNHEKHHILHFPHNCTYTTSFSSSTSLNQNLINPGRSLEDDEEVKRQIDARAAEKAENAAAVAVGGARPRWKTH